MKYCFVFLFLVFSINLSLAQQALLMGRVTNRENKAILEAKLSLNLNGETLTTRSDENGLYHFSKQLNAAVYLVEIEYNDIVSKAPCSVTEGTEPVRFYNFSINGVQALVVVDEHDPFAETYMQKVKKNMITEDRIPRRHH